MDVSRRGSLAAMLTVTTAAAVPGPVLGNRRPSVSVTDFGAVGDGRSDDTEAFRKALASASCVLVPPAPDYYRVTRTLALQYVGQRLEGFGALSQIRFDPADGVNGNLFVTEHNDSSFCGLHLMPGPISTSLFEGWAVAVVGARRVTVENCEFGRMYRGGILLSDSSDCRIEANRFVDSLVRGDGSERQSMTGYDILIAGAASRNSVHGNNCSSGVGTAIGCQTVTRGKSQFGNIIRDNIVAGYPGYGIMVYLSDPSDRIEGLIVTGNSIENISGSIFTDGKTLFYGCGIYLQSCNDMIVSGNRILRTNTDRGRPFSGSAVPAAIGISGYGNAVVTGNVIDICYHGIASIQTTARPRPGDGAIISDNLVRGCDGAGVWLADAVAANVHDNRLTAKLGQGTHGILIRRFDSTWMDAFRVHGNDIGGFAVGVEVGGDRVPKADISSNRVRATGGNAIYCAAEATIIHGNDIEGRNGISLAPSAVRGSCRDNIIKALETGIIDDGISGILVADNIITAPKPFAMSVTRTLSPGPVPAVLSKRWFRKLESSPISSFKGGSEGQRISILATEPFVLRHGSGIQLRADKDYPVARGTIASLTLIDGVWHQTE